MNGTAMQRGAVALAALVLPGLMLGSASAAPLSEKDMDNYFQKLEAGEITVYGANPDASADGVIPAFECPDNGVPPGIQSPEALENSGEPYGNPFAGEEPRFVITADNYQQYGDKLTPGLMQMFKQYPEDFKMKIYPTHRTACAPQDVEEQIKQNVREAYLVNGGTGGQDMWQGPPFPIPDNGLQAIWNNLVNFRAWREYAYQSSVAVYADGSKAWGKVEYDIYSGYNDPSLGREAFWAGEKAFQSGFMNHTLLPARERGTINLGREYMHKIEHRRQTWQYLPGTRRVRRFPHFGYDIPQGAGGLRGVDEDRLFNGSPHKFNWEYKGKVGIKFVPYNTYALDQNDLTYEEDIIGKVTVNPELVRWEAHRMHKIVATLKDEYRHWYNKRVFWLDEDSWEAMLADNYDNRGELWRTAWQSYLWEPQCKCMQARVAAYHDFQARAYTAQRLINETPVEKKPNIDFAHHEGGERQFYSPANLRMLGRR